MEEVGQVFDKFLLSLAGGSPTLGRSIPQSKLGLSLLYSQRVEVPQPLEQGDWQLAVTKGTLPVGHVSL
jgi:hypothetical protein